MAVNQTNKTKQIKRNTKKKTDEKPESLRLEVIGVLLIAVGMLLMMALYFTPASRFIAGVKELIMGLFGISGYILPELFIVIGVLLIAAKKIQLRASKIFALAFGLMAVAVIIHLASAERYNAEKGFFGYVSRSYEICSAYSVGSGAIGAIFAFPAQYLLGKVGGIILNSAFILVSIMLLCHLSLRKVGIKTAEVTKKAAAATAEGAKKAYDETKVRIETRRAEKQKNSTLFVEDLDSTANRKHGTEAAEWGTNAPENSEDPVYSYPGLNILNKHKKTEGNNEFLDTDFVSAEDDEYPVDIPMDDAAENATEDEDIFTLDTDDETQDADAGDSEDELHEDFLDDASVYDADDADGESEDTDEEEDPDPETVLTFMGGNTDASSVHAETLPGDVPSYIYPPLSFLHESVTQDTLRLDRDEISRKAAIIEQTLKSFSITAKVTNTVRGPVLTRYELQPAPGVKVRRIVDLTKDLALNLAAEDIRIEAPIPGKAAIGIEVPNDIKKMVTARELLDSEDFRRKKTPITFALGKDIVGKNVYADIARMPHLLIAGETGSGKSVCINSIIVSLIYGASPKDVQLILVDPKKVELKPYEKIPHLRIPIVTDPKKAAAALNWAVAEMMSRYKIFAIKGAKDLPRYNNILMQEGKEKLPYLVIIIDELADLMMTASKEVEDAICRIAQLGRAAGIHLIIATQTPRVTVITGNIKANVPTKIAFAVSSQMDSRVILDMSGAEKLLGKGDMLYTPPGSSKPIRVQGCYIDDDEIESITDFLTEVGNTANYDSALEEAMNNADRPQNEEDEDDDDERLAEAIRIAIEYDQVSASMLQRRMKVGFNRAARLVDVMEERGYVSASEGAKPRQVLITMEQYNELYGNY